MSTAAEQSASQVLQAMCDQMDEENLWEGSIQKLLTELGISKGHYSSIRTLLIRSGAAVQVRRGGGKAMSRWKIIRPDVSFEKVELTQIRLEERRSLEYRIDDLEKLVGGIDVGAAISELAREVRQGDHTPRPPTDEEAMIAKEADDG